MGKICVVGDFILDVYFNCKPRHNPEGNIPCYIATKEHDMKIGGGGNVKENLETLGSEVDFFYSGERSVKMRIFSDGKYIFRVDDETPKYSRDTIKQKEQDLIDNILAEEYDYILVSDYNKGAITRNVAKTIMNTGSKVIVDCKPNHFKWFKGSYLIKPNEKEFVEMVKLGLNDNYFKNILVTRGSKGMELINKDGITIIHALKTKCIDVTGAGDTVIATLTHFLNKGYPLIDSVKLANKAGAISIRHLGCYAVKEKELVKTIQKR
jgi:rfaE bifunctional protein kinase chain/domain